MEGTPPPFRVRPAFDAEGRVPPPFVCGPFCMHPSFCAEGRVAPHERIMGSSPLVCLKGQRSWPIFSVFCDFERALKCPWSHVSPIACGLRPTQKGGCERRMGSSPLVSPKGHRSWPIFSFFCSFERTLECTWSHVCMCSGYRTRVNFCIFLKT